MWMSSILDHVGLTKQTIELSDRLITVLDSGFANLSRVQLLLTTLSLLIAQVPPRFYFSSSSPNPGHI
ncbi:hypothetical protein N24_1270 [Corynebacterium suranareeae]|uniref:Uncharacterized protein n=1 Tax=Corynebacterium suranareeae TaxID=2506452 RepID=A0A169RUT3_9CORY|nr:hypothetical protein N24_1270 [Corynebacterium suranareeae]